MVDKDGDGSKETFDLTNWRRQLNNDGRPFERVSFNLSSRCGGIPLASFLAHTHRDIDLDYHNLTYTLPQTAPDEPSADERSVRDVAMGDGEPASGQLDGLVPTTTPQSAPLPSLSPDKTITREDAVDILHQTCIRLRGTAEALHFEAVYDGEANTHASILTVISLNGTKRTYQTKAEWKTQLEANGEAARLAIEMGAIDFIRTGDSEVQKHKNAELVARAKMESKSIEARKLFDPAILDIEKCCLEWRAGRVLPSWAVYKNPQPRSESWGAALRISLTAHRKESYSTDAVYISPEEARLQCAKLALSQGVLDYIKYGNGQKEPAVAVDHEPRKSEPAQRLALEEYFETLPKPWPVDIGNKSVGELKASSWVNSIIQKAMIPDFKGVYYFTNSFITSVGHGGLVGCILRLEGPAGRVKTYITDNHFAKRQDAKNAVALYALSQDITSYITSIKQELENKIPPSLRVLCRDVIMPTLISRMQKIRRDNRPLFEVVTSTGGVAQGFGCTLTIDLSPNAHEPNVRKYKVPCEYRTLSDAKLAAACAAAEAGAMDLLRYQGDDLPEGRRTFWDIINDVGLTDAEKVKLTQYTTQDGGKKRKRGSNDEDANEQGEMKKIPTGPRHMPTPAATPMPQKRRKMQDQARYPPTYPPTYHPQIYPPAPRTMQAEAFPRNSYYGARPPPPTAGQIPYPPPPRAYRNDMPPGPPGPPQVYPPPVAYGVGRRPPPSHPNPPRGQSQMHAPPPPLRRRSRDSPPPRRHESYEGRPFPLPYD